MNLTIINTNTPTRIPTDRNHSPTSPDITIISSNLTSTTTWRTINALNSDHLPILITSNIKSNFRIPSNTRCFSNYKKADWISFTKYIEDEIKNVPDPTNTHIANKTLTNLILTADQSYIPKGRFKDHSTPLPKDIRDKIQYRNSLRKNDPTNLLYQSKHLLRK